MSDPEQTDTNWKARAALALQWAKVHPLVLSHAAAFAAGLLIGALL